MASIVGQERPNPPHDWKKIETMILENLTFPITEDLEKLRQEVKFMVEDLKNVCETDKRKDDREGS